jgi:hypothetical protein
MKPRAMAVFYIVWTLMCLLAFATSTVLGFVLACLGVLVRLLELVLQAMNRILTEQKALKTELRLFRISLPDSTLERHSDNTKP